MTVGLAIYIAIALVIVSGIATNEIRSAQKRKRREIEMAHAVEPSTGSRELKLHYENITPKETIERMQARMQARILSEDNLKFLVKNNLPLRKYVKKRYVNLPLGGAKKIWELDLEKITRDREAVEAYKKSARGAEIIAEGRK